MKTFATIEEKKAAEAALQTKEGFEGHRIEWWSTENKWMIAYDTGYTWSHFFVNVRWDKYAVTRGGPRQYVREMLGKKSKAAALKNALSKCGYTL